MTAIYKPREDWGAIDQSPHPGGRTITRLPLTLDAQSLDARGIHQMLEWAMDDQPDGRLLWCRPAKGLVIMQHPHAPTASRLVSLSLRPSSAPARIDWAKGDRIILSGILNPVRVQTHKRSVVDDDLWPDWLATRLSGVVKVETCVAEKADPIRAVKGGRRISIIAAAFHAVGVVENPHRLSILLADGLGKNKAWGSGLLIASEARA